MYDKWDPKKAVGFVEARFDEGDKAALKGHLQEAILGWVAAVHVIRGSLWGYGLSEPEVMVVGGRFCGLWARRALADSQVELHALIADAYLQLEKYRLARVWVESIYGPLHSWDRRHNREKFPLRLPEVNGAQPAVYADLLVVAARISIVHGHDRDAIEELHEASRLDPSNETVDRMMEECKTHLEARSERRRSKKAQQAASAQRKYQAALQVVHGRKDKADEGFGHHNLSVAYEKYEAAYRQIRIIQDTLDRHVPFHIKLFILSQLTAIALEFGNYLDVHLWVAKTHACLPNFLRYFQDTTWGNGEPRNSVMHAKNAFWTAYYCEGAAFQKQGNFKAAIRNFESAMLCNDCCHASYYQLEASRKADELETLKQKAAKEQLQRHQEILQARKDKKARKTVAKHARNRVKKARGPGYIIGVGS